MDAKSFSVAGGDAEPLLTRPARDVDDQQQDPPTRRCARGCACSRPRASMAQPQIRALLSAALTARGDGRRRPSETSRRAPRRGALIVSGIPLEDGDAHRPRRFFDTKASTGGPTASAWMEY
jgi:hypothetical protein